MTPLALIFTLSSIGISETVYLIRKRIAAEAPVCPIGEGCETVLTSKYSKIFIIPNDVLGFLTYLIISTCSAFLVINVAPLYLWNLVIVTLVSIASLMSLIFTYIQWKIIKAWCFWCIMSAITIWLMAIILLASNINY